MVTVDSVSQPSVTGYKNSNEMFSTHLIDRTRAWLVGCRTCCMHCTCLSVTGVLQQFYTQKKMSLQNI